DKITMYGDGNSSKLTGDIIKTLTQVSNGIQETAGVNLSQIINKFVSKENKNSNQNDDTNKVKNTDIVE
ncbi:MAG: flotillin family protein, partial [Firmicutes bacterium]|nr:flotillin family protein [Bacillota bacterium]